MYVEVNKTILLEKILKVYAVIESEIADIK